jgi:cell division protein FtsN
MKKTFLWIRNQQGTTLVGFVVGLLVGLGVSLSVAIYVTRVPVPFVDRGVSRKPAQDLEEAERNKGWNPNAALGGNNAPAPTPAPTTVPVPVPAESETASPTVPPPADGQTAPATTSSTASGPTPAKEPTSADPLGDWVQSRQKQAAPTPAPDPFTYFVQAGAFRSPEDAETQRAKLAMLGIDAQITERDQSGSTVFRVRVGPFNQKSLADVTREQLEVNGVEAALVRIQR